MEIIFLLFSNKDLGIPSYKIGKKDFMHQAEQILIKKSHRLVFMHI